MKTRFIYLIILLGLLSCKKEPTIIEIDTTEVITGSALDGVTEYIFTPAFTPLATLDSTSNTLFGEDSLDLDHDGKYDLFITQRHLSPQHETGMARANNWSQTKISAASQQLDNTLLTKQQTTNTEEFYPFTKLLLNNGIEIATVNDSYSIGLGETAHIEVVDMLPENTNIKVLTQWTEANTGTYMWIDPPTTYDALSGEWYGLENATRYIGCRKKVDDDYIYGWIEVKQIDRENFSFIRYVMENK